MEHGFGCTCPKFGHPPPPRIAGAGRSVSGTAVPDKIDIDILIGWPVALEVVEDAKAGFSIWVKTTQLE